MNVVLLVNLKLVSEIQVMLSFLFDEDFGGFDDKEYLIVEVLIIQEMFLIDEVQKIFD